MDIIKPRTLSGFMELLPVKQQRFEKMVEILRTTYASYGFSKRCCLPGSSSIKPDRVRGLMISIVISFLKTACHCEEGKARRGNPLGFSGDCHTSVRTGSQ